MQISSACLGAIALLSAPLFAQTKVGISIQSVNDAGIALERADGTRAVQNFAAGKSFPVAQSLSIYEGGGAFPFGASSSLDHRVSPPVGNPFPFPFPVSSFNRATLTSSASMQLGQTHTSLHTTGNAAGDPGSQLYDITLTTPGSTQVLVVMNASATLYGGAAVGLSVVGGGINKSWTFSTGPIQQDKLEVTIPVNGSVTLRVAVDGSVTPGASTFFFDGFTASLGLAASWRGLELIRAPIAQSVCPFLRLFQRLRGRS